MNQDEMSPLTKRTEIQYGNNKSLRTKKEIAILRIRNVLNLIFMAGAIAGIIYYVYSDKQTGTYIILGSMVFKIMESAIRLLKI